MYVIALLLEKIFIRFIIKDTEEIILKQSSNGINNVTLSVAYTSFYVTGVTEAKTKGEVLKTYMV